MNTETISRDHLTEMLRECGINPTHQRVEIAAALLCRKQHMCADELMALVNAGQAESSRATVYNTLKLFVEKNLVRQVIVDPSRVFYDSNVAPHFHMYNEDTGTLTDIDAGAVTLAGLPTLPAGLVTHSVDVILRVRRADEKLV